MDSDDITLKKLLWLEDQYEDFSAYRSTLFTADYMPDCVRSVSEAVQRLRNEEYVAFIFDLKVLPGDDPVWIEFDKRKREDNPNVDPNLGFELLKSIFAPEHAEVKLNPPIRLAPRKVIVFSVVFTRTDEIASFGIPTNQIIYKASSNLDTLPRLVKKIEEKIEKGEY